MDVLFSKQAPDMYRAIWRKMQQGEGDSGDAQMIADAMRLHPEFDPFWTRGETCFHPQEINGYVVNPLVHIGLHVVVEKQLLEQMPEEVGHCLQALINSGLSRHDAVHQIAGLWGDLYFRSIRRGSQMNEWEYTDGLIAITPH